MTDVTHHPMVVMCRTTPLCPWPTAHVLTNRLQRSWRHPRMSAQLTGFHSGDAKATFLHWLAHSNHSFAWHVEDDSYLHGPPSGIAAPFRDNPSDVVAVPLERQVGGWVEQRCSICRRNATIKFAWPIARISRRLAREVVRTITTTRAHGHHEVFVGTLCHSLAWCTMDLNASHPFVGRLETSGGTTKTYLTPRRVEYGKVYHPVHCPSFHPSRSRAAMHAAPRT